MYRVTNHVRLYLVDSDVIVLMSTWVEVYLRFSESVMQIVT